MRVFHAADADATFALGRRLGERVGPGTTVALVGDLGAGKTLFAKGVGAGLGIGRVQSPTFVIVQTHGGGRLPMWHADLYRISDEEELVQLGLDEVIAGDGVVLIEWAERAPGLLPADHLEVHLLEDGDGRRIEVRGHGPRSRSIEDALG